MRLSLLHDQGSTPVIITGMHRSGTSLAAALLGSAGLIIGERLVPAGVGNVKGHFEDADFVDLHADILKSQGLSWVGWTAEEHIAVGAAFKERARELVARKAGRAGARPWGWKDPRTTLFMDLWEEVAPGAGWVFLYRPAWEVADSLFRRGTDGDVFGREPELALKFWCHYNRKVLAFMRAHAGRCVLAANDAVVADPRGFVRVVGERLGVELGLPGDEVCDAKILDRSVSGSDRAGMMARLYPEAVELLLELNAAAALPMAGLDAAWRKDLESAPATFVFRDWGELRRLEKLEKLARRLEAERPAIEAQREELRTHAQTLAKELARTAAADHEDRSNLIATVSQREARIAELEKHAGNLEELLRMARKHAGNLEELLGVARLHAANLEAQREELRRYTATLERELGR